MPTIFDAGLPNILGIFQGGIDNYIMTMEGCFFVGDPRGYGPYCGGEDYDNPTLYFDASRSNAIYGSSETVQPSAVTVNYYIRAK